MEKVQIWFQMRSTIVRILKDKGKIKRNLTLSMCTQPSFYAIAALRKKVGVNRKGANKKCRHNKKRRQINANKPFKGELNRKRGKQEIGSGEI
jgi:hypothetical protein